MKKWKSPKVKGIQLAATEVMGGIPEPIKLGEHVCPYAVATIPDVDIPAPNPLECCECPCCFADFHAPTYDEAYNAYAAHYIEKHANGCS